jgi:hypothetical protein
VDNLKNALLLASHGNFPIPMIPDGLTMFGSNVPLLRNVSATRQSVSKNGPVNLAFIAPCNLAFLSKYTLPFMAIESIVNSLDTGTATYVLV